jgi:hypothetical protein
MHVTGEAKQSYRRLRAPSLVGMESVGNSQWHGFARLDVDQRDLPLLGPAQYSPRSELRAIAPHEALGRNDLEEGSKSD